MLFLDLALIGFILLSAILVALFRGPIGATAIFAAFSLGVALVWVLLAAPDVALTEAAVGAGVMVILLLITAVRTSEKDVTVGLEAGAALRPINYRAAIAVGVMVAVLATPVLSFPRLGDADAPAVRDTDPAGTATPYAHYVGETTIDLGISNAVAAVLIVYRSLDTLGEVVVVFTALIGVLIVLDRSALTAGTPDAEGAPDDTTDVADPTAMSPVGATAVRLVVPLVFVFGIYLTTVGTSLPGGGFPGGVVIGATFVLMGLIFGSVPTARWSNEIVLVVGIVLAIFSFLVVVLASSLDGGALEAGLWLSVSPLIVVEGIEVAIGVLVGSVVAALVYATASGSKSGTDAGDSEEARLE